MHKIALCMIVQGDEKLEDLRIAVDSARQYVDEVCITTNGKEYSQVERFCDINEFKHSHMDWDDDFSKQRNFNFSQVSDDITHIFWLDSDDELVGGEYLRDVIDLADRKEMDVVFLTYWYGCSFFGEEKNYQNLDEIELYHNRERIFKKNKMHWKGRIHETPVTFDGMKFKYTAVKHLPDDPHELFPIAVLHRDATRTSFESNQKRNERNIRILEKQLAEERSSGQADPRTLLYLMKIYRQSDDQKDLIKCISYGEEYLNTSGWDEERANAFILVADCFYELGHYDRTKQTLLGALDEWPHNKEIFLSLANVSFSLGKYHDMKTYMDIADSISVDKSTSGNRNIIDLRFKKYLLKMKYALNVSKKIDEAYLAAKELYKIEPNENNLEQVNYLDDLNEYNKACKNIDEFTRYLAEAKLYEDLEKTLLAFPDKFKQLPFYNRLLNKYGKPRVWGDKEICYYASFGGDHFEKWDPTSLKKGVGGSETAVIRLAQEWTKLGYKVTVYGDPSVEGNFDGVEYKSFRRFNPKDRFNIFIQWRSGFLANKVSSKKFFVDLHDVWHEQDYLEDIEGIDKIFVKSEYHMNLAPNISREKFEVISNGI